MELVAAAQHRRTAPVMPAATAARSSEIPEITRSQLSADVVSTALANQSGLVVRGLLSDTSVSRLRELLDEGAGRMHPKGPWNALDERMVSALADVYTESGVTSTAEDLFGETPLAIVGRTLVKREPSGRGAGLGWHQDASFFGAGCGALNVWTALTPCGVTCPSLSLIPDRLDYVIDPDYDLRGASATTARHADRLCETVGVSDLILEPGDAVLFDEMTLHRTSPVRWRVASRDVAI